MVLPDKQITTKNDLKELFYKLGLSSGDDIMVHSSLSSLGYVVNGALDVIDALVEVVGKSGTILMPAHTGQLTDPTEWNSPQVSEKFIEIIKKNMNTFNAALTQVRSRGIISSTFLSYPEVMRSDHPLNSVSALGERSEYYTNEHYFDEPEGINSPIGKLYKNNGKVLLLGVGLKRCTAIHLAEYIADVEYLYINNPVVLKENIGGNNKFVPIKKYPGTSEYFDKYIPELNDKGYLVKENFRSGDVILFEMKHVVDFIVSRLHLDPQCLIKP